MGERKVINKYYPIDYDPSKNKRLKRKKKLMKVRTMLYMSIRCTTCGEYIYKGKKFNALKETVPEDYLGIKVYRFYISCTRCSSKITIKTDPKNRDYVCEYGATRNFEPWKEHEKLIENLKTERMNEEEGDTMKELENLSNDTKIEQDISDCLDELKSHTAKLAKITDDALWELHFKKFVDEQLNEEDEQYIKTIKFATKPSIKRLDLEDNDEYVDETDTDYFQPEQRRKLTDSSKPKQKLSLNVVLIEKQDSKQATDIDKPFSLLAEYTDDI